MHAQVLGSGSAGNALLVRAGPLHLLVDAGLPLRELRPRLEAARLRHAGVDHILVTHGHLDHARSAGALAKRHSACVHCPERIMRNRAIRRAPRMVALRIGTPRELEPLGAGVVYTPVLLPHDCDPTVGYAVEQDGRRLVVLTDMGRPSEDVARQLAGAHVLVLEFNHDREMLANGPYSPALKRRVGGDRGHLSNEQSARMLAWMASERLHTLVLAHLSLHNNTPERALEAAYATLDRLGLSQVEVLVASQDEPGPNLQV